ncbi:hypothetical protein WEIDD23_01366 [Weissella sp. DD23]|nr:hypothetical protein WEIDD23_01366 [Weissella sp. DD23]
MGVRPYGKSAVNLVSVNFLTWYQVEGQNLLAQQVIRLVAL